MEKLVCCFKKTVFGVLILSLVLVTAKTSFAVPDPVDVVYDGSTTGIDIDYTTSTTQLSANWPATSDRDYGIAKYWFAIGTTPGATDVTSGWVDNGLILSVDYAGTFTDGQTYYFTVKAENDIAEESTPTNSDGQTVDISAPVLTLNSAPDPIASGDVTITLGSNETLIEAESEDPPGTGILATVTQASPAPPQNILLTATATPNEWEGTYTVNPAYTGTANVSVSVTDLAGNPQTANDTFTVNAPAATVTVTVNPTLIRSGNITIDIQSSAGLSATPTITVDQSGLTLTPTTPIYSTGTNRWRAVYTIDDSGTYDGTGTVTVDAVDLSSNAIQVIENFTADSTPPTDVTLTTFPTDPTSALNIDFAWSATTDATSGPFGYSYILTQNASATPDNIIELEAAYTSVTFNEVSSGLYYFKIKPLDNAGNPGNITEYSFTIDRDAPVLTIDVDPAVINEGGTVDIRVTSDEALQSAPVVTVTQEGQSPSAPLAMVLDLGTPEIDWTTTYTAVAGDGTATVDASGTDTAGNPATAQTTFEVDSEGPDFSLSIDPQIISTGTVDITVTSEVNLSSLTVDVGGTPVTMTLTTSTPVYRWDGTYTVLTGATEGPVLVTAIGEDAATNTTTKNQTLTIDQTGPVADILIYPLDEIGGSVTGPATTTLYTAPYRIELTVTDANPILGIPLLDFTFPSASPVALTLVSAGGSVWTVDIFIESDTPNDSATFSFSATDEAGNTGTNINSGGSFTVDTVIINTAGGSTQNSDGTKVTTPPNAYTGDYYIVIVPANQSSFAVTTANNTSGVVPISSVNLLREFTVRTAPPPGTVITDFTLPSATIVITIPYPDTNDDGIVDGTNILETNLRIFYLNETLNRWEMVTPYTLDTVNNLVYGYVNHLSVFGLLGIASGSALSGILVYPNPFYAKRDGFVTITNIPLTGSACVYIYNLAGELVEKLEDGSGITSTGIVKQARWDGRNSSGKKCASGMYVYLLKTDFGAKKGKIGLFW